MKFLKLSTAVDVLIGPFVDAGDATTAETGLSPAVQLSKNGQALANKNDATTPTHDAAGYYNCELDATDTNTVGHLDLIVPGSATALPVRHEFTVLTAAAYDKLFGASAAPNADVSSDVTAIKAKTDSLTFTVGGVVDSNVQNVNDQLIQGDGSTGNLWRKT